MSSTDVSSFGFSNASNICNDAASQVGLQAAPIVPQVGRQMIQLVGQQQRPPLPQAALQASSVTRTFESGELQQPLGDEQKLSALMIYLTSLDENLDPQPLPLSNVSNTNASPVMAPAGECAACLLPIVDQYFLMIGERSWHSECLRCCLCGRTLHTASSCFYKDGLIFCREDYTSYEKSLKFSKRCERCASVLSYDDVVMRAREAVFHLRCFTCIVCSAPLHPGELFAMGEHGTLYCQGHYEPVNAASSECPLIRTEPTEVRFGRGKTRCRKGKKTSEDGENGSDNIDYCDDEVLTQSGRSKRMRTSFKHHQLRTMKSYFNLNHNPDAKDLKQLAQRTGLTKRVLQVWFQNARAKFRRNTMQGREGESISPHVSRVSSIPSNEQAAGSGSASLGGGSARTSSSPEEVSQRASSAYEQSSSPTERTDETVMKSEDGAPNVDSPAKTLAEYFESDPALL